MKIIDVLLSESKTGFFFDDQDAIKSGSKQDGFVYTGNAITEGFSKIRQAGEAISVMLVLEDGQIAYGDCAAVQYSGAGGRDPLFIAKDFIKIIEEHIVPLLKGNEISSFRELAEKVDNLKINNKRIHTAIRYGVTQAILDAVAKSRKITMAEVIQDEYNYKCEFKRIPIFGQTGDNRYINVDKMILKEVDVLPHALINNVVGKLGENGEKLLEYITWLKNRILSNRNSGDYNPTIHIDVYGTIGIIFDYDVKKIVDYIEELGNAAHPLRLLVEGPVDVGERIKQVEVLKAIKQDIDKRKLNVGIVADEWCNTFEDIKLFVEEDTSHVIQIKTPDLGGVNNIVEAILYCKEHGVGAYSGGTCNETNRSAEVTTNIAIACGADQVLAKPGMGFDEGYMIVNNEMNRVLKIVEYNKNK